MSILKTEVSKTRKHATLIDTLSAEWDFGAGAPEIRGDHFSVRMTAALVPPKPGEYEFGIHVDDTARLYVDDTLIIDSANRIRYHTKKVTLGTDPVSLRLEMHEGKGRACAHVFWVPPVPTSPRRSP